MNAKPLLGFTLAALVGLALVPVASAQPKVAAASAPVAQSGSSNLTVAEDGQQPASTPRPSRASSGFGTYSDQQAPPAPPTPPAGTISGQTPKVQMVPGFQAPKGQLVNVKVEFTITDQTGAKPPTKKTMTLIVADRENGRIRTTTQYAMPRGNSFTMGRAPLSVDVMPVIDGGKIRLEFSLEYDLNAEKEASLPADAPGPSTNVSERLSAILDSGVPLTIAQSSDAMTDRKLTIEVKATIVK
jgi:hypothetical protein